MTRTYSRKGVLAAGAALAAAALGPRPGVARGGATAPTIHLYNWIDYVHPRTYVRFTKATGTAVRRSYFTSNEALLGKLAAGGRYDLAVPSGYMVETLAAKGLLRRLDWSTLPHVRAGIDPMFRGLPHDPKDEWSVPKDWGTTGFMYRTDLVKERPTTWAQFFKLFAKHPRKLTLLDSPAEVIGSVAVMLGYSFNTDDERELDRARAFLLDLKPNVHSFDSTGYESSIVKGSAFGGLGWNGDGLAVIARSPKNAAAYVVPEEGCELWVDAYVVPKRATNAKGAHAWIDFVYEPKSNALETAYTYFGSPLKRGLLAGVLTPAILKNPDIFPPPKTMRRLEPSAVTAAGMRLRERIWAEIRR